MSASAPEPTLGTAPWRAVTTYVQNDVGSLSAGSSESHATERWSSGVSPSHAAEQRRLAEPGRGGHQRQSRLSPAPQTLEKSGACHQTRSQLRDEHLRCDQWACHAIPISEAQQCSKCAPSLTLPGISSDLRTTAHPLNPVTARA